jgi:hypothetical protein
MSTKLRFSAIALGLVIVLVPSIPAPAQSTKDTKPRKQAVARDTARPSTVHRGTDKFPAGPLYYGNDYLGDDPDPFIRLQIQRDLGARYPGDF